MTNFVSLVILGIIIGMLINQISTPSCVDGYVRINVWLAPAVCVKGYVPK